MHHYDFEGQETLKLSLNLKLFFFLFSQTPPPPPPQLKLSFKKLILFNQNIMKIFILNLETIVNTFSFSYLTS